MGFRLGGGGGSSAADSGFRAQAASPTITSSVWTPIQWPNHVYDDDGMHNTSGANLTGTVAKTSGQSVIIGTSTIFLTEVAVGDVIYVPGGAAPEVVFVQSVDSNTQLTISKSIIPNSGTLTTLRTTASGQTARKANEMAVIRRAGLYLANGSVAFTGASGGQRSVILDIAIVGGGGSQADLFGATSAPACVDIATTARFSVGDGVMLSAFQSQGAGLAVIGDARTSLCLTRLGS